MIQQNDSSDGMTLIQEVRLIHLRVHLKEIKVTDNEAETGRDFGITSRVGQLFPSRGLLKVSIMKIFVLPLNVAWKLQQGTEFGRIVSRTESALSLISSTIIARHWFVRKSVNGHVWNGGGLTATVPALGKIKYSDVFPFAKDGN